MPFFFNVGPFSNYAMDLAKIMKKLTIRMLHFSTILLSSYIVTHNGIDCVIILFSLYITDTDFFQCWVTYLRTQMWLERAESNLSQILSSIYFRLKYFVNVQEITLL